MQCALSTLRTIRTDVDLVHCHTPVTLRRRSWHQICVIECSLWAPAQYKEKFAETTTGL